jgi:glutamate synthase domain-containing protein 2
MVVRKVANPAPSVLALVNPRRRKKAMATRKRRRSTRRRTVRHTAARTTAPKRRRSTRRRRHTVFARRRAVGNPYHRRRRRAVNPRRRRRNPLGGAGGEILNFTVAGLAQGIAMPFVGGFAGRFLPFGQYNPPIIAFGTGWLLSQVFKMFGITRRFSHPAMVFGSATAAMMVLQPIVARTIGGGAPANPTMAGPYRRAGMRGIGVMPGIPQGVGMAPMGPPAANGMQGLGMWPGVPQGVPMR